MKRYVSATYFLGIVLFSLFAIACSSTQETYDLSRFHENGEYEVLESVEGIASYYANRFHGRTTANGEIYNKNLLTAAHKTYPFGTVVRVTSQKNGKSIIVRINDRGPHIRSRIIDLSRVAAEELNMIRAGLIPVKVEVLSWGE